MLSSLFCKMFQSQRSVSLYPLWMSSNSNIHVRRVILSVHQPCYESRRSAGTLRKPAPWHSWCRASEYRRRSRGSFHQATHTHTRTNKQTSITSCRRAKCSHFYSYNNSSENKSAYSKHLRATTLNFDCVKWKQIPASHLSPFKKGKYLPACFNLFLPLSLRCGVSSNVHSLKTIFLPAVSSSWFYRH